MDLRNICFCLFIFCILGFLTFYGLFSRGIPGKPKIPTVAVVVHQKKQTEIMLTVHKHAHTGYKTCRHTQMKMLLELRLDCSKSGKVMIDKSYTVNTRVEWQDKPQSLLMLQRRV